MDDKDNCGYEVVKIIGFLAGTLYKVSLGDQLDSDELRHLNNIADDFGYWEMDLTNFKL